MLFHDQSHLNSRPHIRNSTLSRRIDTRWRCVGCGIDYCIQQCIARGMRYRKYGTIGNIGILTLHPISRTIPSKILSRSDTIFDSSGTTSFIFITDSHSGNRITTRIPSSSTKGIIRTVSIPYSICICIVTRS